MLIVCVSNLKKLIPKDLGLLHWEDNSQVQRQLIYTVYELLQPTNDILMSPRAELRKTNQWPINEPQGRVDKDQAMTY